MFYGCVRIVTLWLNRQLSGDMPDTLPPICLRKIGGMSRSKSKHSMDEKLRRDGGGAEDGTRWRTRASAIGAEQEKGGEITVFINRGHSSR